MKRKRKSRRKSHHDVCPGPLVRKCRCRQSQLPWQQKNKNLSEEVLSFAAFLQPTAAEVTARQSLYDTLTDLISDEFPQFHLTLFGSASTSLSTFRSDLDIRIQVITPPSKPTNSSAERESTFHHTLSPLTDNEFQLNLTSSANAPPPKKKRTPHKRTSLRNLNRLASFLHANPSSSHYIITTRSRARHPIINLIDPHSSIQVDIGFDSCGEQDSTPIVDQLSDMYPAFPPLALILKEFLKQYQLDKVFDGGIGSFRLYILLGFFFDRINEQVGGANVSLWRLLWLFFKFYSDPMQISREKQLFLQTQSTKGLPVISCSIDFSNVYHLDKFIDLCNLCSLTLQDVAENGGVLPSSFAKIFCVASLIHDREISSAKSANL